MLRLAALLVGAAAWAVPTSHAQPLAWEHVGGEANINGLAFDEADTLWAIGPSGRGLFHMPPETDTWIEVSDRDGERLIFTDAGSIVITTVAGLARSTDRGRTFESVGQPAGAGLYVVPGGPLAGRLFAGVRAGNDPHGAAFSTDDGVTWTHAPIVRDFDTGGGEAWAFAAVEGGPHAGRVIAACTNGLAFTDDGGHTWAVSSLWQSLTYIVESVIRLPSASGPNGGRLLAGVDGGGPTDVWASDDDGATWEPLAVLGPSAETVRLVFAGETAAGPKTVYAVSGFSDVWRSGDGGATWETLGNVYPEANTSVKDAVLGPDGRLYVAQKQPGSGDPSDGLYRTVAPVTVAAEDTPGPSEPPSLTVYPNPSSGAATVSLTLAETAEARVAVFDVLGREVAVLHDGPLAAGTHRFAFDGASLPAGVYLVRVESGRDRLTERITLLR